MLTQRTVSPTPQQVVVVEDDESTLQFLTLVLTEVGGYRVITCRSGATAVDCVRTTQPQAVILDTHLETPDMGWQVLRELKADPRLAAIPVIVSSADARAIHEHAAVLRSTGSASLSKPFVVDDLLGLVQGLLGS